MMFVMRVNVQFMEDTPFGVHGHIVVSVVVKVI